MEGLIIANPDKPDRPVNSPDFVYQIVQSALDLLRTYGTQEWAISLSTYLASREALTQRYAKERHLQRIPLTLQDGESLSLTAGSQNVLVEQIVHEFLLRLTPGGTLLYVGDAGEKFARYDPKRLADLGVAIKTARQDPRPDRLRPQAQLAGVGRGSDQPRTRQPKRVQELRQLFAGSKVGLVYVTAFLSRAAVAKYLGTIAWETEVWVAEAPDHLIHFNGERFLGPR